MKRSQFAGHQTYAGLGLEAFTPFDMDALHQASLELLQDVGIFLESEETLSIFEEAGAIVDRENMIVKIPRIMVEDAINSAPATFTIAGRDPKNDFVIGSNRVAGFAPVAVAVTVKDLDTGKIRPSELRDVEALGKFVDALSSIVIATPSVQPRDVDERIASIYQFDAILRNCAKSAFISPEDGKTTQHIIDMAAAVVGGYDELKRRPIVTCVTCPQSPLVFPASVCECVVVAAKAGIPNMTTSMVMSGGTGPVTLAGTMVIHNAEMLGVLVLCQIVNRGTPYIYGSCTTGLDLRNGTATTGSPEHGIFSVAVAKMAQYYGMPSFCAGNWSNSMVCDAQIGHEKTLCAVLSALAGVNIIYGSGGMESGMLFDFGQFVVDNDFNEMILQALRGMPVNEDTIQLDLIKKVGIRGDFLSEEHTLNNMRACQKWPTIMDRNNRTNWELSGSTDMYARANEVAKKIIASHKPLPLSDEASKKIEAIVRKAEQELGI